MITETQLRPYGVTGRVYSLHGSSSPELLDYLDLIEPRRQHNLLPDGVAESMGRPLLFFVDESKPASGIESPDREAHLSELRRKLACRGERAYLARVRPGQLMVVPVTLDEQTPDWKIYRAGTGEALTFFSRLALGRYDGTGEPVGADFVFSQMFDLLKHSADDLAVHLERSDVLSLVGRALFFRFLRDRQVVKEENTGVIAPRAGTLLACFDTAENAAATCRWLDRTFNGDFLPLPDGGNKTYFETAARKSDDAIFVHLGSIVRGAQHARPHQYQLKLDWGDFDFAHIPIGLMSQVYEAFCWRWERHSAKEASIYYTPRTIAATLVDEAFDNVRRAAACRVLDPACGAGVFLVLAFRRLYRERWRHERLRPDTKSIRAILETQLAGFDISESALRLAALSLYLTAIELDPKPVPPEKLKFKKLRDSVLFNFRREHESNESVVIGSLGDHVGNRFDSQFDLVLSNPPWTSWLKDESNLALELDRVSKAIISHKADPCLADNYHNPDHAPDLPFLLRSTVWCKPNGRIAMALPARILLKQEEIPSRARETVFRLIEVTGIINGSNLSDTKVWPNMQQPFMLLFARNRAPKANHVVRLITPHFDSALNRRGEIRIDSKSVQPVELEASFADVWLWKTLTVGTTLDVEIIRRIRQSREHRLEAYWNDDLGLVSSTGYKIEADQPQKDASFLHGLANFHSVQQSRFVVRTESLQPFARPTLNRPRRREVYAGPILLVKESPGIHRRNGWALLSLQDVAYDQSFYGYSAATSKNGEMLVRYLQLFVHSHIWLHYALLTSPKLGAERRTLYKSDLDDCPIIPFDQLSASSRSRVRELSRRLTEEDETVFTEIDEFFGELYGLTELDLEVIRDTLEVSLPYRESRERSCRMPTNGERDVFRRRVESLLRPFFRVLGKSLRVEMWKPNDSFLNSHAPFGMLHVGQAGQSVATTADSFINEILTLANDTGSTQIVIEADESLVIGILNQYRYWTPSRARLLVAEVLRQHGHVFEK